MNASLRRGACPGLSVPMATGDGLLARLMPIDGIALDAFVAFCAAARRHGNGTIEVSARGSLQVRGLTDASASEFAAAVAVLAIPASDGVPVTADPLGNCTDGMIDSAAIAARVRTAIASACFALSPKVSITVDRGGPLHLDALAADVKLRAVATTRGPMLHVAVGGNGTSATPLAIIPPDDAPEIVTRIFSVISSHGSAARAADILRRGSIGAFRSAVADARNPIAFSPRPAAEPIGTHPLRDGSVALGIAPAFGHAPAERLIELAEIAGAHGVRSIRPAPGRALLLVGTTAENAPALAAAIAPLGFVTCADDPRRRVIACPGKPACASGFIEARELAVQIAARLPPGSGVVHISGCTKGCAHPMAATLTVVGSERGCGIVRDSTAHAAPSYYIAPAELAPEVARVTRESTEPAHG